MIRGQMDIMTPTTVTFNNIKWLNAVEGSVPATSLIRAGGSILMENRRDTTFNRMGEYG